VWFPQLEVAFAYQDRSSVPGTPLCALCHSCRQISEEIMVLCGDVPLITAATLRTMVADHLQSGRDATLLAVDLDLPHGYGRILTTPDGRISGIVEEADATDEQRAIRTINSGSIASTGVFWRKLCRASPAIMHKVNSI